MPRHRWGVLFSFNDIGDVVTDQQLRSVIRRQMRLSRQSVSRSDAKIASKQLLRNIINQPLFLKARRIALYLPNDGEIDIVPLMEVALQMGKQCYLPILSPKPHAHLWFAPYQPGGTMKSNRFGILEPDCQHRETWPIYALDLVFTPLVAFDKQGNRLGMGGGFYDRAFSFLHNRKYWKKPRLVGAAYDIQEADGLPFASWDVPLYGVVTETGLRQF